VTFTAGWLLQLIHSSVVDTSVVFPHRLGCPYKRALKNLAADLLQRIIQNDGQLLTLSPSLCGCILSNGGRMVTA